MGAITGRAGIHLEKGWLCGWADDWVSDSSANGKTGVNFPYTQGNTDIN